MNNLLYARLAKTNLSKNRQNILPYLLSCIGTVVMFFIMDTLAQGSGFDSMIGKDTILTVMGMGTYIIGLFAVIFLPYFPSDTYNRIIAWYGDAYYTGLRITNTFGTPEETKQIFNAVDEKLASIYKLMNNSMTDE